METTLRPLTVSEILDRTAQLYRSNFLLFAGISSVYAGVLLVLSLLQIALQEILRLAHMTQQFQWLAWGASGVNSKETMRTRYGPLRKITLCA